MLHSTKGLNSYWEKAKKTTPRLEIPTRDEPFSSHEKNAGWTEYNDKINKQQNNKTI